MTSHAPHHIKMVVGSNIKAARAASGLTQRALAARVNDVDTLAVQRWESGRAMPRAENLVALGVALGRDPSWFYVDHSEEAARA